MAPASTDSALEGLRVHLRQLADGSIRPTRLGEWVRAPQTPGEASPNSPEPANPSRASGLRRLEVVDASLRVSRELPRGPPASAAFEEVSLALSIGSSSRLVARGRLGTARIDVELAGTLEAGRFEASVRGLDLGAHRAWPLQLFPELPAIAGVVDASLHGERGADALRVESVSLRIAGGTVGDTALPALQLRGSGSLSPRRLRLADLELVADALTARGSADLTRPFDERAEMNAAVRAQRLPFATLSGYAKDLGLDVVADRFAALGAGSFDAVNLAADEVALGALDEWLRTPTEWPQGLRLEADVRSDEIALEEGEPLRGVSGRIAVDGDALRLPRLSRRARRSAAPRHDPRDRRLDASGRQGRDRDVGGGATGAGTGAAGRLGDAHATAPAPLAPGASGARLARPPPPCSLRWGG